MRLILILALLLHMSPAHAQKFTLGLNLGGNYTTVTDPGPVKGDIGLTGSLRGMYTLGRLIEAGVLLESGSLNTKRDIPDVFGVDISDLHGSIAMPYYLAGLMANIKGKHLYGGVMLGYMMREPRYDYLAAYNNKATVHSVKANNEGAVTVGAQLGYTLFFSKKIGLNAEAAAHLLVPHQTADLGNRGVLYFPVSLGLRYRIS